MVNKTKIDLKDLQSIGKRKTSLDFGMALLSGFGSGILMSSLFDLTPTSCLSCHAVNSFTSESTYDVSNTLNGSVFVNTSFDAKNTTIRNPVKWKLAVIE